MTELAAVLLQQARGLVSFLDTAKSVAIFCYDGQGLILAHNPHFAKLVAGGGGVVGRPVSDFLVEGDRSHFQPTTTAAGQLGRVLFKSASQLALPLECSLLRSGDEAVVLGEQLAVTSDTALQKMSRMNNEMVNLTRELQQKNRQLEHAAKTIRTLRGILPICSFCKGIRNDEGYWNQLEEFVSQHTEAQFSHSICPDCARQHYPDLKL